jgi:hypothetical protein
LIAEGGVGMPEGALVGVAVAAGFQIRCTLSSLLNM